MSEPMTAGGTWGRYRLGERIGVGGMAEVYKAIAPGAAGFEKACVIKRILPEYAGDKSFVSMFVNEARIGASLAHPNIVQIYDFGEIEDEYFMSMEYIHGTDLARFLWRLLQRKRTVPGPLVAFIAVDVLKALEFAHNRVGADGKASPVIHRDVSPQNILVSMDGLVKLADFGLARALDHARLTRPGTLKGKLSYMSPEQAFGREMDHRTDLFSLGIVMYELLVGKSLFRAKTDAETLARVRAAAVPEFEKVADVHPMLVKAMRKALSREAADRYGTAAEFRRALVEYLRTVTPPVEAATLGALVRDVVQGTQKPPESTAEATEMADLDALKVAEAPTAILEAAAAAAQARADSDAPPPDGPWVEGPAVEAMRPPGPTAPAKRGATPAPSERRPEDAAARAPDKAEKSTPRPIPPVESKGVVRVEQVVILGRGSQVPPEPKPVPVAATPAPLPPTPAGGVAKLEEGEQATLLAAPKGYEIPMTPPHGTEALHDRATQLFAGKPERDSSDPPGAPAARDSEEKVTIMFQQAADLPVGIVPATPAPERPKSDKRDALALPSRERTAKGDDVVVLPRPQTDGSKEKKRATPPAKEGPAPLFTMSAQAMHLHVPSEGPDQMGSDLPPPPTVAVRGPGIAMLLLIGLGLLVVSAVVTWAIVSF